MPTPYVNHVGQKVQVDPENAPVVVSGKPYFPLCGWTTIEKLRANVGAFVTQE